MTPDQDFSVAASSASVSNAPDNESQDAPKPKRRTSSRSSRKTTSDATSAKDAVANDSNPGERPEVASTSPAISKSRSGRARAAAPEERQAEPAARPGRSTARNAQRSKSAAKLGAAPEPEKAQGGDSQKTTPPPRRTAKQSPQLPNVRAQAPPAMPAAAAPNNPRAYCRSGLKGTR